MIEILRYYCNLFIVVNMVRERDAVWQYWKMCDVDVKGKQYAACRYCNLKLQVNASRFKQHLVVACTEVPADVKEKFRDAVLKQSCATTKQKLQLPLAVSDDTAVSASTSSATFTPNNSQPDTRWTQKRLIASATTGLSEVDANYDNGTPTDLDLTVRTTGRKRNTCATWKEMI